MIVPEFDVFMSPYETGGGDVSLHIPTVSDPAQGLFVESPFSFTDPPRYYKANDPYYYKVDNIPIVIELSMYVLATLRLE